MKTVLAIGLMAAAAVIAAPALAQNGAAPPPRPIPYSQLDAYMKASPRERASRDWWSGAQAAPTARLGNAAAPALPGRSGTAGIPGDTSVALDLRNSVWGENSGPPPSQGGGVVINPTRDTATGLPLPEALEALGNPRPRPDAGLPSAPPRP